MTWSIASYSATPSGNTLINGINIAEGCNASGINDAIRQLMADLATQFGTAAALAGTLAVAGNATLSGTLGVTGAATFSSTLGVTGLASFVNVSVSGALGLGVTGGGWTANATFEALSGNASGSAVSAHNNSVGGAAILARVDSASSPLATFNVGGLSTVGSITTNLTSTAYNTSSDARLKTNIKDANVADAWAVVNALRVRSWDWISNDTHEPFGFVAQEEVSAAPFAVAVGDNDPTTISRQWGRDDGKLVPALVRAIQDLEERLASLEAKG